MTSFKNSHCERCMKPVSLHSDGIHTCTPTKGWASLECELQQAKELMATLQDENLRLNALADKWNIECDETREDNNRLEGVCQDKEALIAELSGALEVCLCDGDFVSDDSRVSFKRGMAALEKVGK